MHKIAVLSDTHNLLRPEVVEILRQCECILHAGDISKQKLLEELQQIAPTYVVRGNNDREWAKELPETLTVTLFGVRFFMVHNKKQIPKDVSDIDVIICGHSHKYEERYSGRQLFLNPGSCGPRRFTQPITMAVLEILDGKTFQVKKIEIPHTPGSDKRAKGKAGADDRAEELPRNIRQIIQSLMKDTERGRSVKEMADKYGISEELAEQICRLYLTHPGVDADGIMTKMGL